MTSRDHEYTMKMAEEAIARIRGLSLPADPLSYELWYTYATRHIPDLNQRINDALERNGTLSCEEVDNIYNEFLRRAQAREIGTKLSGEIDRMVELLDELILSTAEGRTDCVDASEQLKGSVSQTSVRAIADTLIKSLRSVETKYAALEHRLAVSKPRDGFAPAGHGDLKGRGQCRHRHGAHQPARFRKDA
jgi:diguanylate cyclase